MTANSRHRALRFLVLVLTSTTLAGCELVEGFLGKSPEERLVETVRSQWLSPGRGFVDGAYGRDTIASVEEVGERTWRVTIPVEGALGDARTWELAIESVEVYRVFAGEEYARFLNQEATALNRRATLPREAWLLLTDGEIVAVGVIHARVSRADRSGSAPLQTVAFLRPGPEDDSQWTLEPESRTTIRLREALRLVYDELILRDDRVITCMGSANPRDVPRPAQLDCVNQVLDEEFGPEEAP